MLLEEDFKNKYLQHPISFLSEENLDKLETHCRKASKIERGIEHKVVLELLDRYYQYQKEIQDKNNKLTKLQKENEDLQMRKDNQEKRFKKYKENIDKKIFKNKKFCSNRKICWNKNKRQNTKIKYYSRRRNKKLFR